MVLFKMARHEADREDLFSELLSYQSCWEFSCAGLNCPVICGIRADGRMAIFFGPDPVFHFNGKNQLLRSYWAGNLFRTQGETLARLQRVRSNEETALVRHDLNAEELAEFLHDTRTRLQEFHEMFSAGKCLVLRTRSLAPQTVEDLFRRLGDLLSKSVKLAPAYPTKKR